MPDVLSSGPQQASSAQHDNIAFASTVPSTRAEEFQFNHTNRTALETLLDFNVLEDAFDI